MQQGKFCFSYEIKSTAFTFLEQKRQESKYIDADQQTFQNMHYVKLPNFTPASMNDLRQWVNKYLNEKWIVKNFAKISLKLNFTPTYRQRQGELKSSSIQKVDALEC